LQLKVAKLFNDKHDAEKKEQKLKDYKREQQMKLQALQ